MDIQTHKTATSKPFIFDAFFSKDASRDCLSTSCFYAGPTINFSFSFTGKELDSETGYSYFGARYIDHENLTNFLSVDRFSSKYPSVSPYSYCAWNPVKLVDLNGDSLFVPDADSQQDIKDIAGVYAKLLEFGANGNVSINISGLSNENTEEIKRHDGMSLLFDLVSTEKKILYEASDVALVCSITGTKTCGFMSTVYSGIINLSNGGLDSKNGYSEMPREGYDGHVIVSLSGRWIGENNIEDRSEVVAHELAENYARTVLNYDYNGIPSAHDYANSRMHNPNKSYYYIPFVLSDKQLKIYGTKIDQYLGY